MNNKQARIMASDFEGDRAKAMATQTFLKLYRFVEFMAFRYAPNRHLQDDIIQDVFLEFVGNAHKWDPEKNWSPDAPPRALLKQITRNVAMRYWRDYLATLPEELRYISKYIEEESLADEEGDSSQDELEALGICMDKLPQHSRILIDSRYFAGMSITDIASQTKRTVESIYMAISRIRTLLRDCINRRLKGLSDGK